MDYQLKDKRALVTGSSAGIGLAIAKMLAGEGARVVINGRSEDGINRAIHSILEESPKASLEGLPADFGNIDSINHLVETIGQVDILVNNVGIFTSQSFGETSDEDWYRLFEVNVMSGVRLSRAFLPNMMSKNWGRIVFISSECAMLVPEDLIAYSMTKAALLNVSRGLAQTTRGSGVTVNSVVPGSTLSEGAERFLQEAAEKENISTEKVAQDFFKNVRTSSLIERFATTDEVAQLVTYLCSPLSSATNGSALKADGGSVPGII